MGYDRPASRRRYTEEQMLQMMAACRADMCARFSVNGFHKGPFD